MHFPLSNYQLAHIDTMKNHCFRPSCESALKSEGHQVFTTEIMAEVTRCSFMLDMIPDHMQPSPLIMPLRAFLR